MEDEAVFGLRDKGKIGLTTKKLETQGWKVYMTMPDRGWLFAKRISEDTTAPPGQLKKQIPEIQFVDAMLGDSSSWSFLAKRITVVFEDHVNPSQRKAIEQEARITEISHAGFPSGITIYLYRVGDDADTVSVTESLDKRPEVLVAELAEFFPTEFYSSESSKDSVTALNQDYHSRIQEAQDRLRNMEWYDYREPFTLFGSALEQLVQEYNADLYCLAAEVLAKPKLRGKIAAFIKRVALMGSFARVTDEDRKLLQSWFPMLNGVHFSSEVIEPTEETRTACQLEAEPY